MKTRTLLLITLLTIFPCLGVKCNEGSVESSTNTRVVTKETQPEPTPTIPEPQSIMLVVAGLGILHYFRVRRKL